MEQQLLQFLRLKLSCLITHFFVSSFPLQASDKSEPPYQITSRESRARWLQFLMTSLVPEHFYSSLGNCQLNHKNVKINDDTHVKISHFIKAKRL